MNENIAEHYATIIESLIENKHTTLSYLSSIARGEIQPNDLREIWSSLFVGNDIPNSDGQVHTFLLRPEIVLQYYSYKQYKHSIESSIKAQKTANISIWIAIGALLINLIGLICQFFITIF